MNIESEVVTFAWVPADPLVSLASSIHASPKAYAFLIGSGVSSTAGVPTGWAITLDLVERYAALLDEDTAGDPASWCRDRFGAAPDCSTLIAELAPSADDRQQLLSPYFEPDETEREQGLKLPTAAHHSMAQLVTAGFAKVFVTTNFDRLLDTAIREAGVEPRVISSADHARGALPLALSDCTIIKVHGDYLSTDLRNTVEELSSYPTTMNRLLREVFSQYGLVVCGWSAESDVALRKALLRSTGRRFSTYWMHRREPEQPAQDLIQHRGAIPVSITDADNALDDLAHMVLALSEAADSQPQDTETAVALLKRYLPEPVHRIRLADLIRDQTRRVIDKVSELPLDHDNVPDIYEDQVRAYESVCARLARLLAVGAYFGDTAEHDKLWVQAVERLANHRWHSRRAEKRLLDLRQYPALLAIYATALGAAAADRIDPIARIIATVQADYQGTKMRITFLINRAYAFDSELLNRTAEVPNGGHMAGSHRLFRVLRDATSDFIDDDRRYQDAFDEIEYLIGVSCGSDAAEGRGLAGIGAYRRPPIRDSPDRIVRCHSDTLIANGVFRDTRHLDECSNVYNDTLNAALPWRS